MKYRKIHKIWKNVLPSFLLGMILLYTSCTKEELNVVSSTKVSFQAIFDNTTYDTETDFIPMRNSQNLPAYNNFKVYAAELIILREVKQTDDRWYKVVHSRAVIPLYRPDPCYLESGQRIDLKSLGFQSKDLDIILQEGNYNAYLILNGPQREDGKPLWPEGIYIKKDASIINGPEEYLRNMRDFYYSKTPFEVKKATSITPEETSTQSITLNPLKRYAAPIRFILQFPTKETASSVYLKCDIYGIGNQTPIGFNLTNSNYIWGSNDESQALVTDRIVSLPAFWDIKNEASVYQYPNYTSSNISSIFILAPTEGDKKVNIEITDILTSESHISKLDCPFKIKDITANVGKITTVILYWKDRKIVRCETSTESIETLKKKWIEDNPSIPFEYIELKPLKN